MAIPVTCIDPECLWTGTKGLLFMKQGTRVTHYHEQGSCGMHLDARLALCNWHSFWPVHSLYQILNIFTVTSYYVTSRFCLAGRISKGGMPAGRINEAVNLCHGRAHGDLDLEAHFISVRPKPPLSKSGASQAFTQTTTAITVIVSFYQWQNRGTQRWGGCLRQPDEWGRELRRGSMKSESTF